MRIAAPSTMRIFARPVSTSVRKTYQVAVAGLVLAGLTACSSLATAVDAPLSTTPASSPSGMSSSAVASSPMASSAAAKPTEKASQPASSAPASPAKALQSANAQASAALTVLKTIPVKGRAPKTGYARTEFGQAWADVDHNGCDTRNDILTRDLSNKTYKPGTRNCVVLTGVLADPYTAKSINFQRGADTSSAVQIDHVVALSDAWQKGAQKLSVEKRTALANDPQNLLAVDGPANQQKSDSDAASWLPANKSYRCTYVSQQITVKAKYSLWVTQGEHDAMTRVLSECPAASKAPAAKPAPKPVATKAPAPKPAATQAPVVGADNPQIGPEPFYANCKAVRAAGKAPIYKGQPGFLSKFDGDGDGVGCE